MDNVIVKTPAEVMDEKFDELIKTIHKSREITGSGNYTKAGLHDVIEYHEHMKELIGEIRSLYAAVEAVHGNFPQLATIKKSVDDTEKIVDEFLPEFKLAFLLM